MSLLNRIRMAADQMTPTDKKIAEAVMADPELFARTDTAEISEQYGFSQPALTRFAKKIGYSGYAEFRYDIARNKNNMAEEAQNITLSSETARLLEKTEELFPADLLEEIAAEIGEARHIFVTGYHRSRASAQLMNTALLNYRYSSEMIPYDEVFKLDSYCRKEDMLIVFSVRSKIFVSLIKELSECENRPKIVLVTCAPKHEAAKYCDRVIVLPDRKTIQSPLEPDPAITTIFFINLLSMHLKTQE
ncbi:MAG: MurR/RpiR family transcriptional regulator [Solobacterium sp.]|nr:MurR/RpiR family transcriptional regulator [Solobacterium sp.]